MGHLFFQNLQHLMWILEKKQKIEKKYFLSEIIGFELVAVNSHFYEDNTCHSQLTLTNILKSSDITKRDIFQHFFHQSDKKILSKCCCLNFSSV